MNTVIIDGKAARRAAQAFNLGSVIAALFVYASMAHYPNEKVVSYTRWAGYRFYGVSGFLVIFGSPIYSIFGNWEGVVAPWAILVAIVVPAGIRAIVRAHREEWPDTTVRIAPTAA